MYTTTGLVKIMKYYDTELKQCRKDHINFSLISDFPGPCGSSVTGDSTVGDRKPYSSVDVRSPGLVGGLGDNRGWVWGSGTVCGERDVGLCSTSSSCSFGAEYQPSLSSSLAVG